MENEDHERVAPVGYDQKFLALGWHCFMEMYPNLKGHEKLKAEKVFAAAFGIFQALQTQTRSKDESPVPNSNA